MAQAKTLAAACALANRGAQFAAAIVELAHDDPGKVFVCNCHRHEIAFPDS
jgi:hypothetical protein